MNLKRWGLFWGLLLAVCFSSTNASAAAKQTALSSIPGSETGGVKSVTSGEKPQSKLWEYAGTWWAVLATDENDKKKNGVEEDGLWLWKLDRTNWKPVLRIAGQSHYGQEAELFKADAVRDGSVVHVLMHFENPRDQSDYAVLASLQYDTGTKNYKFWRKRATERVKIPLASSETASIALDGKGRMWLATEQNVSQGTPKVKVLYADAPYETFKGPVYLSGTVKDDDISAIATLPDGSVGVLWSNQARWRFEFKLHKPGDDPTKWSSLETITKSVLPCKDNGHFADDHINLAVGDDGTLYAAVKTTYDSKNCPAIALLSRSKSGTWKAKEVQRGDGTRPITVIRPSKGRLYVVYTDATGGGNIVYKGANLSGIDFSKTAPKVIFSGKYNNVTSTKESITTNLVVVADGGRKGKQLTF